MEQQGPGKAHMPANWLLIVSGNGLAPVRRQAITWTNDYMMWFGPSSRKSSLKIEGKSRFVSGKYILWCRLQNVSHSIQATEY